MDDFAGHSKEKAAQLSIRRPARYAFKHRGGENWPDYGRKLTQ
jgi:hypothetical protein